MTPDPHRSTDPGHPPTAEPGPAALLTGLTPLPMPSAAYTPATGDADYRVEHYDLKLDYRLETNRLDGRAVLDIVVERETRGLRVDLVGLRLGTLTLQGARLGRYRQGPRHLHIGLAERARPGDRMRLTISYSGMPGPRSTPWGEIGWEELEDGVIVSGQPIGASTWFPCNDRLGYLATFTTRIGVDHAYTAIAIGELTERRRSPRLTWWTYEQREPAPVYLTTMQIGAYTQRTLPEAPAVGLGGAGVAIRLAYPEPLRRGALREFEVLPRALEWFSRVFGPYPFAAYTTVVTADDLEIPLESMGLATFGANHVRSQTREPRLVVHELAHMWFGNSVGLRRWRDIWLNEGFACYAEWLWSEHIGEESAESLARRHHRRVAAAPADLVLADPGPDLLFDDRVYKRGALTLHALRRRLGDDAFFDLLRRWTAEHRGALVVSADFERLAAEAAGAPLDAFFDAWLRQRALPAFPAA